MPTGGSSAFKAPSPKSSRPAPQEAWRGPLVQGSRLGTQPSGRSADLAPELSSAAGDGAGGAAALWMAGFPQGHGAPCPRGQAFRIPSMCEPMVTSLTMSLHKTCWPSAFSILQSLRAQEAGVEGAHPWASHLQRPWEESVSRTPGPWGHCRLDLVRSSPQLPVRPPAASSFCLRQASPQRTGQEALGHTGQNLSPRGSGLAPCPRGQGCPVLRGFLP